MALSWVLIVTALCMIFASIKGSFISLYGEYFSSTFFLPKSVCQVQQII